MTNTKNTKKKGTQTRANKRAHNGHPLDIVVKGDFRICYDINSKKYSLPGRRFVERNEAKAAAAILAELV